MAETLPELISGLAAAASRPAVTDVGFLSAQFGKLEFVHLRRRNVVAQGGLVSKVTANPFLASG